MFTKGQTVKTVYGDYAEIMDGYDGIYTAWINGQGLVTLHETKIIAEVK